MTFGALASNYSPAAFIGAIGLAIGIGIQNIPEGQPWLFQFVQTAHLGGKLLLGSMSAIVEPIAAVIGAFAVTFMTPILPYALSFAAGAMILSS